MHIYLVISYLVFSIHASYADNLPFFTSPSKFVDLLVLRFTVSTKSRNGTNRSGFFSDFILLPSRLHFFPSCAKHSAHRRYHRDVPAIPLHLCHLIRIINPRIGGGGSSQLQQRGRGNLFSQVPLSHSAIHWDRQKFQPYPLQSSKSTAPASKQSSMTFSSSSWLSSLSIHDDTF